MTSNKTELRILAKTSNNSRGAYFQLEESESRIFKTVKYCKNGDITPLSSPSGDIRKAHKAFLKAIGKAKIQFDHTEDVIEKRLILRHKQFKMGTGGNYRLVGMWSMPSQAVNEANPNLWNALVRERPKACNCFCDHCGTSIVHHFIIKDDKGEEFSVGSDCILKLDNTELIEASKALANEKKREENREKSRLRSEARASAREAKLEKQREENGGLTDYELKQKKRTQARALMHKNVKAILAEFAEILKGLDGDFCRNMYYNMDEGIIPSKYCQSIILEIIVKAKSGSKRVNTKAYNSVLEEFEPVYREAMKKAQELKTQFYNTNF
ncbi:hypothetical protein [Vibrio sp. D431a]|uniref:hypothetical protein n=1 Tax=Vibrio sp. D431a TaxID=2837388 RepID=UPI00255264A3|nr:hypothetical protein [Vibrio sp. D431a]MDK9789753.1 hypothetical protein [Vibrio sp. D431a]